MSVRIVPYRNAVNIVEVKNGQITQEIMLGPDEARLLGASLIEASKIAIDKGRVRRDETGY